MNRKIKKLLLHLLSKEDLHITSLTPERQLQSLLDKLAPVSYEKDLIRLGPIGDGGYLVPDDLEGISACFSPGVDCISGFELDCAEKGMKVFLADKSVEKPPESHDLFKFTKKYVGSLSNNDYITLDNWVSESLPESNEELILQIDIEGAEYEVFLSVSDDLVNRFRIIVVEFHILDQLWNKPFFDIVSRTFEKLLQTHTCVHNHPNNCCGTVKRGGIEVPRVTELTFIRSDRVNQIRKNIDFPHVLDSDNTENPSLLLPECWYKK